MVMLLLVLFHLYLWILYPTLLQVVWKCTLKRLPHRILSLESTTHPEGAGDE
jgi:hypothetical protein